MPVDDDALHGTWLHAHEEDDGDQLVYRPASHPLPPSRGRDGFDLSPGGALTNIGIAPADGKLETTGNWNVDDDVLHLQTDDAHQRRTLKIVSLAPDKLVVTREPQP